MVTIFAAKRVVALSVVVSLTMVLAACAVSRAFTRGMAAARAGDWDAAVEYYRQALQDDPDRADYKIALERATFAAAAMHADRARKAEEEGRLEEALREYRRASELDPSNRQVAAKAAELERTIRERIEAARPRPEIERCAKRPARLPAEPLLNPDHAARARALQQRQRPRHPELHRRVDRHQRHLRSRFHGPTDHDQRRGVTLEQALQQIMLANQMFYKVLNERTILVINDTDGQAHAVRRAGGPHVLPVARRRAPR